MFHISCNWLLLMVCFFRADGKKYTGDKFLVSRPYHIAKYDDESQTVTATAFTGDGENVDNVGAEIREKPGHGLKATMNQGKIADVGVKIFYVRANGGGGKSNSVGANEDEARLRTNYVGAHNVGTNKDESRTRTNHVGANYARVKTDESKSDTNHNTTYHPRFPTTKLSVDEAKQRKKRETVNSLANNATIRGCYLLYDRNRQRFEAMTMSNMVNHTDIRICENMGPGRLEERDCFVSVLFSSDIPQNSCRLQDDSSLGLCAVVYRNNGVLYGRYYCKLKLRRFHSNGLFLGDQGGWSLRVNICPWQTFYKTS